MHTDFLVISISCLHCRCGNKSAFLNVNNCLWLYDYIPDLHKTWHVTVPKYVLKVYQSFTMHLHFIMVFAAKCVKIII